MLSASRDHILQRETGRSSASISLRQIYSSRKFVDDLDIINELDGHSGCVNALSWSKSGRLLASGSDDRHLNIHAYQPDTSTKQFQFKTTVATGHTQNIFSVKFMPHSSDNTIVTCAGDDEVRVFDLEYSGPATNASSHAAVAATSRRAGRHGIYTDVRYLTDGDTNARVYRSHADRAKRVVTEDSPYLFLTCSEDGEVRQWDTRQPSSYYPRPRPGVYVPPPLISYRRFGIDLNTISCSGAQPYYITLGGSHINCFLHDRRMAGRSRAEETGRPSSAPPRTSENDEIMAEATRCVRRFAPPGKEGNAGDSGHITACKISDARPNEVIVSWSHDNVYAFDMVHDRKQRALSKSSSKKRKRHTRTESKGQVSTALRINYGNGQHEDIPLANDTKASHKMAKHITRTTLRLAVTMFDYGLRNATGTIRFTRALEEAASLIDNIDEISSEWTYPINPTPAEAAAQRKLKAVREKVRRFVQTAGCLARLLGGTLDSVSDTGQLLARFTSVTVRSVDQDIAQNEQFCYDLIKAIILWVQSGPGAIVDGFTRPTSISRSSRAALRLPIPAEDACIESLDEHLKHYLLRLAGNTPLLDIESDPMQSNRYRVLFDNASKTVISFFEAVSMPFRDSLPAELDTIPSIDRLTAQIRWARKVARCLLHQAFIPFDIAEIFIAFGGTGEVSKSIQEASEILHSQTLADEHFLGPDVLKALENGAQPGPSMFEKRKRTVWPDLLDEEGGEYDDGLITTDNLADNLTELSDQALLDEVDAFLSDEMDEEYDDDDDDDEDEDDDDVDMEHNDDDESAPNSEDYHIQPPSWAGLHAAKQRERARARASLGAGVPCVGPFQSYSGHLNVRTVKDVNYYGLDDEYVVSGSDDGNFFIWEARTGKLVNILEGDGEVVNVIQGHPYEPMLAVSGIDHTIKIFSPDSRARTVARLGKEISAHDPSTFSSIAWPHRSARRSRGNADEAQAERPQAEAPDIEDDSYIGPQGLSSRQRMNMRETITRMNTDGRNEPDDDSMMTSSYFRLVARYLQAQRAARAAGQTDGPGDSTVEVGDDAQARIVIGDDCAQM